GLVTVDSNANVTLNPGGIFNVLAGHKITVDGAVSAPGGQISLVTSSILGGLTGSVFTPSENVGDFDVVINGDLSVRGQWVNNYGVPPDDTAGTAWLDGGSITLYAAPRVSAITSATPSSANQQGARPPKSLDGLRIPCPH